MVNIYTLTDPTTFEVRYVGKTKSSLNKRLNQHMCSQNLSTRSHTTNWISKLKSMGLKPIIELVEMCSFSEWEYVEKYWIEQFRCWGFRLTNTSPGGDSGCLGYSHTKEAKRRIGILNSRPKSQEWKDNAAHALRRSVGVPIIQLDFNGVQVNEYESFYEAAECVMESSRSAAIKNIHACCNRKRKSAYGWSWKYKT